jgi:hypothetical protein
MTAASFRFLMLCLCLGTFPGCQLPGIDAGHEGVLVQKPLLFGHGGVDPVPISAGRAAVALTTEVIEVDLRPLQHAEEFVAVSSENTSVPFQFFLITQVIPGRSPDLIQRFGPNWYTSNIKEAFRTIVREEAQKYPMFVLTTQSGTRTALQQAIAQRLQAEVFDKLQLPVQLLRVVIGSLMPPSGAIDQAVQSVVQEQRQITLKAFQQAEEAREGAERQRGRADRAYREHLGLSGPAFVDLRKVEVQLETIQHSPRQDYNVIMDLETTGIHVPPISRPKEPKSKAKPRR